jgi:hypothetical protein
VNKAKAVAFISAAFKGAFSTPPVALTWAPILFIGILLPINSQFAGFLISNYLPFNLL